LFLTIESLGGNRDKVNAFLPGRNETVITGSMLISAINTGENPIPIRNESVLPFKTTLNRRAADFVLQRPGDNGIPDVVDRCR
jgi:hypothetical protein